MQAAADVTEPTVQPGPLKALNCIRPDFHQLTERIRTSMRGGVRLPDIAAKWRPGLLSR